VIDVVDASIAELRAALDDGRATAVELVEAYLARIDAYDGPDTATALNAIVVRNPDALAEAAASDERRARGETLTPGRHPLHGEGQLPRAGTHRRGRLPAFAELIAQRDAFTIERLRAAGRSAWADEHAADGQRRHAARRLRTGGEPVQRRLADRAVRLRIVERVGHGDRGILRGVRTRRGDVVERPRAGEQQRAVRLHALARRHLHARQLAARAHDGRRRPPHPDDGRPARCST
jgi:hypothetical protein